MQITVYRSFITVTEQQILRDWLENEHTNKRTSPWNYKYWIAGYNFGNEEDQKWEPHGNVCLKVLQNIPDFFFELRQRIIEKTGYGTLLTPRSAALVTILEEGGGIELHKDSSVDLGVHYRCNVLVSKAESGGELYIDGEPYSLEETDLICFPADQYIHEVKPVIGNKRRMVISYPAIVRVKDENVQGIFTQ